MREFKTEVVLSLTTKRLLCNFSDMHEFAEYLAGEPIFTHQFAYQPFVDSLCNAVFCQHPEIQKVDASRVSSEGWEAFRDSIIAEFGPTLSIVSMRSIVTDQQDASFVEPLRGKPIIALDISE